MKFSAGQWLDTYIPGVAQAGGFTIISAPSTAASERSPHFELAVKKSPQNQPAAWLWRPSSEILNSTLHVRIGGSFVFPPLDVDLEDVDLLVFVAGGVGINPMLSMLSFLTEEYVGSRGPGLEVCILYSSKMAVTTKVEDILFVDRISTLFRDGKLKGRIELYITGGIASTSEGLLLINGVQVEVRARRLSTSDLKAAVRQAEYISNPTKSGRKFPLVYVCGPLAMTDELVSGLTKSSQSGLSLDCRLVKLEKWW